MMQMWYYESATRPSTHDLAQMHCRCTECQSMMQMWYYESAIYIQKLRLVTMEAKGMKPEVTP